MKRTIYLAVITLITIGCILFGVYGLDSGISIGNPKNEIEESATLQEFKGITIDAAVMDLEVRTGTGYALDYRGTKSLEMEYRVENEELIVKQTKKKNSSSNNGAVLVLTVPRDASFETVNIRVDVGEMELDGMTIVNCQSSVEVGEIELNNVSLGDAVIDTDTGDIKLQNCSFDSLDVSADVGDVEIHSSKNLDGFSFDIKTDVGEVEVNDEDFGKKYKESGENGMIIVKGDVGDISVDYE